VDEITLFAELKPAPPADTTEMKARVRARLHPATGPAARPVRRRRRLVLGLSAVTVAACAATVVPSVLLSGGGGAAYAVTRNPDGTVKVTISDIVDAADAAGLQNALAAEGIHARVYVGNADHAPASNPACQAPASNLEPRAIQLAVVSDYPKTVPRGGTEMVVTGTAGQGPGWVGYIIQPAAMPRGSVLYISRMFQPVMAVIGDGHGHITAKLSGQAIPEPVVLRHDQLPC